MYRGATKQEVEKAKEVDLQNQSRWYSAGAEKNKTIYYYHSEDRVYGYLSDQKDIYVPIENYAGILISQLDSYLNRINRSLDVDNVKVLITLRSVVFPNEKEFQLIDHNQSVAVWEMVQRYTKYIMQLIGHLAECVLIDNCANNSETNRICINIALFKSEILEYYDIPYDDYVAFSTSFNYIISNDPTGNFNIVQKNVYYNPNHTSKDIGWCKKDNIWDQLRTEITELNYIENAKLQVKATLDCSNLNLEDYLLTPVIVFDFDHGMNKLKERYPHHIIYSAYDIFPAMALQLEKYFQIIAAYVSGLSNKLNITETDLIRDERLRTLFNTSVKEITSKKRELDKTGLIKLARDVGKPIKIMA